MASTTLSEIMWPRPAVADCIFCMIVRDTRGVALDQEQRFNFFPASPLCSVTSVVAGDWHLIDRPEQMDHPRCGAKLPSLSFAGAQLRPPISWNPGETCAITIAFYPDALSAMTGLDLSPFTGRIVSAEEVLPHPILEPCRAGFDAVVRQGSVPGFSALEDGIETLWTTMRPAGTRATKWTRDWSQNLAVRAARADGGRSPRQIARRIKSWTGVSGRDLQGFGHSEQLYARLHDAFRKGDVDWAGLAAASGFADQAHMIRRMRRHTGFTPEQLRQSANSDEAFWAYRLLGQYFAAPSPEAAVSMVRRPP
jgi:AraC-like DNA-binding protein